MTLRITAVDGRPDPVDVDPNEQLRFDLTGLTDRDADIDVIVAELGGGEPVWRGTVAARDGHVRIRDLTLSGEQAYRISARIAGQQTWTFGGFRTAPRGPWPQADSIWADSTVDPMSSWCLLRKEFQLSDKPILWASLFVTAGSPEPYRQYVHLTRINGALVGSGPVRSVATETRFDGFDVTAYLRPDANAISVTAATSDDHRFLARLVIAFADGDRLALGSDRTWHGLSLEGLLHERGDIGSVCYRLPAENLDLGQFPWGYDEPGFDDRGWSPVVTRAPFAELVPTPTPKVEQVRVRPLTVSADDAGRIHVDFGQTWLGGIALRTRDAVGPITIRYGERLRADGTVHYELNTGNVYQETILADGQDRTWQPWGMRVFRYAELTGLPDTLSRDDIAAIAQLYPLDPLAAGFTSSDPVLDQIWQLAARSIRALNGNLYVDSWTRERLAYEADIYIQQRAHLCLQADPALARYSVDYIAHNRTWPTEWPFYTVLAAYEDWQRTADLRPVELIFDQLLSLLPDRYLDPATGLITKQPGQNSGLDGDLVDWPPVERDGYLFGPVNTVVNALATAAYRAAAALAAAIDRPEADRLAQVAARLTASMIDKLYDVELGAFVDGLDEHGAPLAHHSVHASGFALWARIIGGEQADRVADYLRRQGLACSVYAAAFVIDALFDSGHGDTAVDFLTGTGRRSWANMIRLGAGATMEAWDDEIKPNLSYSHPWGASPAYLAIEGILGLRPLAPGYRRFAVRPQLGRLDRAAGVLPTVAGPIAVNAERRGGLVRLDVTVPDGLEAVIYNENGSKAHRVGAGHHRLLVTRLA